jgi:signal transduction histidine kinase
MIADLGLGSDYLRQVVDALPVPIIVVDANGHVVIRNRAEASLAHGSSAPNGLEQYGRREVCRMDGSACPLEELPIVRSLREGKVVTGEQLLLSVADRPERVPILVNSAPLRDARGDIVGGVAMFEDISGVRELERQKEDFLSSAAHDLRSPITALKGQVQLLQRRLGGPNANADEATLETVAQIAAATERITRFVDQILDVARVDMGRALQLDARRMDLVELLRACVEAARPSHPRREVALVAAVPSLVGTWDAARVERVVANLLDNAIKYSPEGGPVAVYVGLEPDWVVVRVEDHGLGIPGEELSSIFERFQRGSNVEGSISGTGIGLAYARQVVIQHGGTIDVASRQGEGSTFTVRLPLDQG